MMAATQYQKDLINHYVNELNEFKTKVEITAEDIIKFETFCAIAIELMKSATPSRLRDAARLVEMRHITKGLR